MKTIKDLAAGKVILRNDGTHAELQEVLQKAFPQASGTLSGSSKYYMKDNLGRSKNWMGVNDISHYHSKPVQSVSDFLRREDPWVPEPGETVECDVGCFEIWDTGVYLGLRPNGEHAIDIGTIVISVETIRPLQKKTVSLAEIAKWKKTSIERLNIVQ